MASGLWSRLISIHAPLAGSDLLAHPASCAYGLFQSTLPSRGATIYKMRKVYISSNFNPRSPRGERRKILTLMKSISEFQPALPSRGATYCYQLLLRKHQISTRAPLAGSDRRGAENNAGEVISTRAPLAGSDDISKLSGALDIISTRAPLAGSDSEGVISKKTIVTFQPALPSRGATEIQSAFYSSHPISTRAPLAGSDFTKLDRWFRSVISTHAPLAGSDPTVIDICSPGSTFQPTLPSRGATAG